MSNHPDQYTPDAIWLQTMLVTRKKAAREAWIEASRASAAQARLAKALKSAAPMTLFEGVES